MMSNLKISEVIQHSHGGGTHQHVHTGKAPTSIHTRERPEHETIKMSELGSAMKAPTSKHTRGTHPPECTHGGGTRQLVQEPICTPTTNSQKQIRLCINLSIENKERKNQ